MKLRAINLNLLPVLREVLRTSNVTRAGEAIGLSQSATSTALGKLRHIFKDDLLVMVGREMQLTRRGRELAERIEPLLTALEGFIDEDEFDPLNSTRCFRIATADYVVHVLGVPFLERLSKEAPGLRVEFIDVAQSTPSDLATGTLDFLIAPAYSVDPAFAQIDLQSTSLFREEFVGIIAGDSRDSPKSLSMDEYFIGSHVMWRPTTNANVGGAEMLMLAEMGKVQHNAAITPHYYSIPFIVGRTQNISLVHRRLFEEVKDIAGVREIELPFEAPVLEFSAFWSAAVARDKAHQWVREVLQDVGSSV